MVACKSVADFTAHPLRADVYLLDVRLPDGNGFMRGALGPGGAGPKKVPGPVISFSYSVPGPGGRGTVHGARLRCRGVLGLGCAGAWCGAHRAGAGACGGRAGAGAAVGVTREGALAGGLIQTQRPA